MWNSGDYTCCNGDVNCANNRTKKLVDFIFNTYEIDKDTARDDLYCVISDREEDIDYYKNKCFKLSNRLTILEIELENARKQLQNNIKS